MKTFLNVLKISFITVLAVFFMGCEGPEGPRGPSGADGTDGTNGATGAPGQDGQNGQNGEDGNANVKSYTFSVDADDWTDPTGAANQNEFTLQVPAITQDIVDNGAVHMYLPDSGGWRAMPFTFISSSNSDDVRSLIYIHRVGEILCRQYLSDAAPNFTYVGPFKVIVVAGEAGKKAPDLDWSNYEEVAAYYNL